MKSINSVNSSTSSKIVKFGPIHRLKQSKMNILLKLSDVIPFQVEQNVIYFSYKLFKTIDLNLFGMSKNVFPLKKCGIEN